MIAACELSIPMCVVYTGLNSLSTL